MMTTRTLEEPAPKKTVLWKAVLLLGGFSVAAIGTLAYFAY